MSKGDADDILGGGWDAVAGGGGGDGGDGGGDGDDERAVTHRARLPGSVFAYQVLSGRATSSDGEREAYAEILAGLRGQPPPVPDVAIE